MLALQDQAAYRRDRTDVKVQPLGWAVQPPGLSLHFQEEDSAPLSALAGDPLGARFRCWRGASGRRYVFSIYGRRSCPAYDHAVIMIAAVQRDGDRRVLFIADTGCFPDVVLARAAARWMRADAEIEFHIHLLATSPAARRALIADLSQPARS
jgi:hypothetical protein